MYINNSKYKRSDNREVFIEKTGCYHELEMDLIEDYDTVELVLTTGEKLAEGVVGGFGGYRGAEKKTLGYFSVSLFIGTEHKEFDDFKYIGRYNGTGKQTKFLRMYPTKCVLIEKNIIARHEYIMEEIRKLAARNPIIFGG